MGIPDAHFHANIGTPMPIFGAFQRENRHHIVMPIYTVNIRHPAVSGKNLGILMPMNTFTNHIQIQLLTLTFID